MPVDAEPVADATAEPQGVPNFDDEPQVAIDTEGAVAENHEACRRLLAVRRRFRQDLRMRAACRSWTAPVRTRVPRWPCRLCLRSRPTRLSPSRTCAFAVRR